MSRIWPILLVLAACADPEPPTPRTPTRLPALLARLVLAEDVDWMTPVSFGHELHLDARLMGKDMACADCHHPLREDPDLVPRSCSSCHPSEDEAHDDPTGPPDI
jgi:Class III cytochrome C family